MALPTNSTADAFSVDGPLQADVLCLRCRANLRNLLRTGVCPKCGLAVEPSAKHQGATQEAIELPRRFVAGAVMIAVIFGESLVTGPLHASLYALQGSPTVGQAIYGLLMLASAVNLAVLLTGILLMGTAMAERGQSRGLRIGFLVLAIVFTGLQYLSILFNVLYMFSTIRPQLRVSLHDLSWGAHVFLSKPLYLGMLATGGMIMVPLCQRLKRPALAVMGRIAFLVAGTTAVAGWCIALMRWYWWYYQQKRGGNGLGVAAVGIEMAGDLTMGVFFIGLCLAARKGGREAAFPISMAV